MEITIAYIFPDLLNLYGDRGNILALKKRLEDRNITANIKECFDEKEIDFDEFDIIYLGGGSERSVNLALKKLCKIKDKIKEYAEKGKVILGCTSGYEMLGNYIEHEKGKTECLGILDIHTLVSKKKFIGNIIIKSSYLGCDIAGFENHNSKIINSSYKTLGSITKCSSGRQGDEGVIYKNVIATHIYGPVLPKNPVLTDYLISKALEFKYGECELCKLDDTIEMNAHNFVKTIL